MFTKYRSYDILNLQAHSFNKIKINLNLFETGGCRRTGESRKRQRQRTFNDEKALPSKYKPEACSIEAKRPLS